jgi:two-component system response regulator FlrC
MADPREPLTGLPLGTPVVLPLGLSLPELERFWLLSTLSALKGNRTHCAAQLDIALRTVRNKINEYKADGFAIPASQRGRDED